MIANAALADRVQYNEKMGLLKRGTGPIERSSSIKGLMVTLIIMNMKSIILFGLVCALPTHTETKANVLLKRQRGGWQDGAAGAAAGSALSALICSTTGNWFFCGGRKLGEDGQEQ